MEAYKECEMGETTEATLSTGFNELPMETQPCDIESSIELVAQDNDIDLTPFKIGNTYMCCYRKKKLSRGDG